jgi:hypothetical protein
MPYRAHSEHTPPYSTTGQVKKRPSAAWFAVGAAMLVVSVIVFVVALTGFLRAIAHTDAEFTSAGVHQVTLPADSERAIFVAAGQPVVFCPLHDGSGTPLRMRSPESRFTYHDWVAVRVFDTGDGHATFSCRGAVIGEIRIARMPSTGDFAGFGLLGILFPLGLGGAGCVVLLVTTILWVSRSPVVPSVGPGPPSWQPGQPPGWQIGRPPGGPPPAGPPTWPPSP